MKQGGRRKVQRLIKRKEERRNGKVFITESDINGGMKDGRETTDGCRRGNRTTEFKQRVKYGRKEGQEEGKSERTKDYQDRCQQEERRRGHAPLFSCDAFVRHHKTKQPPCGSLSSTNSPPIRLRFFFFFPSL